MVCIPSCAMGCPRAGGDRAVPLCLLGETSVCGVPEGIVNMNAHVSSVLLSMSANFLLLLVPCEKVVILHT